MLHIAAAMQAYTCVTEEHLRALTVAQLSAICTKRKLQDSNKKAPMVEVLMGNGIMYKDLTVELLTALCKHYRKDILPRWRKEQIIASLLEAESEEVSVAACICKAVKVTDHSTSTSSREVHRGTCECLFVKAPFVIAMLRCIVSSGPACKYAIDCKAVAPIMS